LRRDISLEEFDYTLNVNLRASFLLVKGVVEDMKAQNFGRIIFLSSIAAYGGGINGCRVCPFPNILPVVSLTLYLRQTTQQARVASSA
jgi:NAD(P)-dependent dehydrogenase (short-subunit alcohol dehydrogenase family)